MVKPRIIAVGCLSAVLLLFVPPIWLAGPLLGGVLVGILGTREKGAVESYRNVAHGVFAGGIVGTFYFLMVSNIGVSIFIAVVPYERFLDYSVRTIQSDFRLFIEQTTGGVPSSILAFSLFVGVFAVTSMVVGEALGKGLTTTYASFQQRTD